MHELTNSQVFARCLGPPTIDDQPSLDVWINRGGQRGSAVPKTLRVVAPGYAVYHLESSICPNLLRGLAMTAEIPERMTDSSRLRV